MSYWLATFERFCFDFQPVIYQSVDVVFKTRRTPNDPKFEDLAWEALYEQMPSWVERDDKDFSFKIENRKCGWSSAMLQRHSFTRTKRTRKKQ